MRSRSPRSRTVSKESSSETGSSFTTSNMDTVKLEELKTKKAQYLMSSIATVESFNGEPSELELFLEDMEAVHELLQANLVDPVTDKNLNRCFVARISKEVLMETGIRSSTGWKDIKHILKERYGGAREPPVRDALALLRTSKGRQESSTEFARRIGEKMRVLKKKILEVGEEPERARVTADVIEDLLKELLKQQVPERIRTVLQAAKVKTLEETVRTVKNDEEDVRRYRDRSNEPWQVVERRSPRPQPRRKVVTRNPRPFGDRPRQPRASPRAESKRYDRGTRERPTRRESTWACWECSEVGHLARNCPYVFRRDKAPRKTLAEAWRGNPMEVNALKRKNQRRTRTSADSESSGGEASYSSRESTVSEDASSAEERRPPGRPGKVKAGRAGVKPAPST